VESLYNAAKERLDRGDTPQAAALFDEVERQHPYSPWARRAQLMSAFSYYIARDYNKSIQSASALPVDPPRQQGRALRLLPDRAELLRADQRRGARPEDHPAGAAALNEVIRRYPRSQYAADARLKLDLVNDHLAGKEMEIGRFTSAPACGWPRSCGSARWSKSTRPPATRPKRCSA
jgi:outer membrane protein assembly factor BamD